MKIIKTFNITSLKNLLHNYFFKEEKQHFLTNRELEEIVIKIKDPDKIIKNTDIILYVTSNFFTSDCFEIIDTDLDEKVYIYYKLLYKVEKVKEVQILCVEYKKTNKEITEMLNVIGCINKYVNNHTFNQPKFSNVFQNYKKDIKNVKKSIFSTLFPQRKKNFTFNPYNKSSLQFVSFAQIPKAYLDLKDRHITIQCPICKKKYFIDKDNIEKMFFVQKNDVIFNCDHSGTEYLKEFAYKVDLDKYLDKQLTKKEKIMFVLNNIKYFFKDEQ